MKAVTCRESGDVDVLEISQVPEPKPGPDEVLVRNFATALNRADLLQRRGLYPPPKGDSDILGLEFAGEVADLGSEAHPSISANDFKVGDRVFGLIGGGGYAEYLTVHRDLCMRIPDTLSYDTAAAIPEAYFTAYDALFDLGGLRAGETALIHSGASGVGTAAIQMSKLFGARVWATAGSAEKVALCRQLGAEKAVDYHDGDFASALCPDAEQPQVDVVLDLVGASHWPGNLRSLRLGGRYLVVGLLGGRKVEADLGVILRKRLRVLGTVMRARSLEEKIAVTRAFSANVLPHFESAALAPILDRVLPLEEVRAAHARLEANENLGKIVLRM